MSALRFHGRSFPALAYEDVGQTPFIVNGRIFNVQNAEQTYSAQRCTTRPIMRFEAHPGDFAEGQTDRIRSELQCTTKENFASDVWVSYSLRLTATPSILSDSMVLGQFHQTEDEGDFSGFPPFEMNLHADGLHVFTATVPTASRPTSYLRTERAGPLSFPLDEYNSVVIRAKFGWSSDAELDVWINGAQELALTGISMGMNDAVGPYWKFGIYYSPETAEQVIVAEYANFEVSSDSSLLARVTDPRPVY